MSDVTHAKRASAFSLSLFALAVFVSRLPFVAAGYGDDPDSWRMANAAHHIVSTGVYQASRLPGYPLPETIYAVIWSLGGRALTFNLITAAMSALCSAVFALHLRRIGASHAFWGAAALAFTPVFYINSTDSVDYDRRVHGLDLAAAGVPVWDFNAVRLTESGRGSKESLQTAPLRTEEDRFHFSWEPNARLGQVSGLAIDTRDSRTTPRSP